MSDRYDVCYCGARKRQEGLQCRTCYMAGLKAALAIRGLAPEKPGVLVMPGWIHGYCPLHVLSSRQCHATCMPARLELARIAADLDAFWCQTIRNAAKAEAAA